MHVQWGLLGAPAHAKEISLGWAYLGSLIKLTKLKSWIHQWKKMTKELKIEYEICQKVYFWHLAHNSIQEAIYCNYVVNRTIKNAWNVKYKYMHHMSMII